MIYILILITLGAIGTILICKSIATGFESKAALLKEKEQLIIMDQNELRRRRKELKKELEEVKIAQKNQEKEVSPIQSAPKGLKDWLVDSGILDFPQIKRAEKYADEKNLELISALLTLNMITVDTYESVKKMKLK
ncbi:hypothetical protein [Maridesulfovibrio zosterae]|uniref:hypothetical protein n=1 Tax=Maridesulfovibrio zosterae TaxID=82171 RepID=UPI00041D6FA1|nr:hypothetical protein [Maridesulfovibrio zosterae]